MTNDLLTPVGSDKHIEMQQHELNEGAEFVGPGLLLSEARKKLLLSTEDITKTLNFKKSLVKDIEKDVFDQTLPATFNRGYLRNYAKLVNIDVEEVLTAYDMLGVVKEQRNEMQSFSNITEKEAKHNQLMWVSYFIVAVLFGLMVLWWLQAPGDDKTLIDVIAVSTVKTADKVTLNAAEAKNSLLESQSTEPKESAFQGDVLREVKPISVQEKSDVTPTAIPVVMPATSTAVFTFSGDCWVKIYDATGERVAWGVKKSGYVMTITAKQPFKVTLGKPKLVSIMLNDQQVDMSSIDINDIASFTLPLESE